MRRLIIAGLAAGFMMLATAPAFAGSGPGGTSEGQNSDGSENNQVDCGTQGRDVNGVSVIGLDGAPSGASGSLVVCNDDGDYPIQGRIIATGDASSQDGYVAADGDADNASQGQGYTRVSGDGVECGDVASGDTDAANTGQGEGPADAQCQPAP